MELALVVQAVILLALGGAWMWREVEHAKERDRLTKMMHIEHGETVRLVETARQREVQLATEVGSEIAYKRVEAELLAIRGDVRQIPHDIVQQATAAMNGAIDG